jgi:gluconokinase
VTSLSSSERPSSKPQVCAIDIGTSGVRAALFDERGHEVTGAQARRRRAFTTVSDFAELDPDQLVDEVIKTVDELFTSHSATQIEFIAISAFWHSLMGIDAAGLPTTPVLTWADTRAAQFAKALRSKFSEPEIHARTGCRFHPSYWPAKLEWLRSEHKEKFRDTRCWVGFAEYLCLRLFGERATSISMASATGLFNQRDCDWDWDLVEALGISPDTLPEIRNSGGKPPFLTCSNTRLTDSFASRWPALAEARLVTIVGDGAANNIGAGCSTKDRIALMVGTSGAMRVVFAGGPPDELSPALWSYRVCEKRVAVGGALSDGGGLLQWLTEALNFNAHTDEVAELESDAHGLTVLPFWSGERSTGWSTDARGGILGLRQGTKPVEIIRATLESIAYRFALIARALDPVAPGATIFVSGNALRSSPVWLQIIADVLGRPLMFGGTAESSIRGAALLALEAVGKIASIEEDSISVNQVYEPDMSRHARYQQGLARQEELYERLYRGN